MLLLWLLLFLWLLLSLLLLIAELMILILLKLLFQLLRTSLFICNYMWDFYHDIVVCWIEFFQIIAGAYLKQPIYQNHLRLLLLLTAAKRIFFFFSFLFFFDFEFVTNTHRSRMMIIHARKQLMTKFSPVQRRQWKWVNERYIQILYSYRDTDRWTNTKRILTMNFHKNFLSESTTLKRRTFWIFYIHM